MWKSQNYSKLLDYSTYCKGNESNNILQILQYHSFIIIKLRYRHLTQDFKWPHMYFLQIA